MMPITFPVSEHPALRSRAAEKKDIYTTRVSSEKGKYKVGDKLSPDFDPNVTLVVQTIDKHDDIKKHPFYNELTAEQREMIEAYGEFEVIKLKVL